MGNCQGHMVVILIGLWQSLIVGFWYRIHLNTHLFCINCDGFLLIFCGLFKISMDKVYCLTLFACFCYKYAWGFFFFFALYYKKCHHHKRFVHNILLLILEQSTPDSIILFKIVSRPLGKVSQSKIFCVLCNFWYNLFNVCLRL